MFGFFSSFSRVGFVLAGQENQDVSFSDNNFLFFLAGNDTGKFVCPFCVVSNTMSSTIYILNIYF